jgi:diguanylate cyclase (GGDEF)-like protein
MVNIGRNKIGRRIVLLVFLSVTLSVIAMTGMLLWLQLKDSIAARKSAIEATGYVYASAVADPVASRDSGATLQVLRSISRVKDISFVSAMDNEGRPVAALGATAILATELATDDTSPLTLLSRGALPVSVEIVKSSRPIGTLVMIADLTSLRSQFLQAAIATLLAAIMAGLLGVALAVRLQKRITGPIMSLTRAMSHIRSVRDYSTKVKRTSDDETGVLVDTFNSMMSEIGYRDEALKRLAFFDPLTGLANRQEFQRHLDAVLEAGGTGDIHAAVILLDLDEFKSINDTYGHTAGDALLVNVAANLKQECPDNLHISRLGGDEFAIVATGVKSETEAQEAVAPMVAALMRPIEIMSRPVLIGASIGIAMIPRDGATSGELLRRADLALYSAKRAGRGRVHCYNPKMDEDVQIHTAIANDLRFAVSGQQMELHYQPQVSAKSFAVVGVESLLRWKHPTRGYVSPGLFVPIAESAGLISELGRWVLQESCLQAKHWLDSGVAFGQVSVNVSVAQIRQYDFCKEVAEILDDTGLPPDRLCLELTESLFAGSLKQQAKRVFEELKQLGVSLAIDDFGTGYSSLAYLHSLPFDKLKVDRAFISGVDSDRSKRKLLSGIIELGRALDLSIIAEGAETVGEVECLRKLRADEVQGYFFSKPVPAPQVAELIASIPKLWTKETTAQPEALLKAG